MLDQGVEVRVGIRAEADHEVVERPEGDRALVGGAATVEPNAEPDLLQFAGERVVGGAGVLLLGVPGVEGDAGDAGVVCEPVGQPHAGAIAGSAPRP